MWTLNKDNSCTPNPEACLSLRLLHFGSPPSQVEEIVAATAGAPEEEEATAINLPSHIQEERVVGFFEGSFGASWC